MELSDNVIKDRLPHVYWIIGTSCAGKSTMAAAIAERHGMNYYDWNNHYARFKAVATSEDQPFLSKKFEGPEDYFSQPVPEYVEYLERQTEEALEMVVADFLSMPREIPIITETIHVLEMVRRICEYNRVAFLYVQQELFRKQNWDRSDAERQAILGYMQKTHDPERHMNHVTEVGIVAGKRMIETAKQTDVAMFERTAETTVPGMLDELERHFQLK